MRYGNPSIASAVAALSGAGVSRIVALPLFPQYSEAAHRIRRGAHPRGGGGAAGSRRRSRCSADFYADPRFIAAFARVGAARARRVPPRPPALQLPRPARAPGEGDRRLRPPLPGAATPAATRSAGRTRTATARSASPPRARCGAALGVAPERTSVAFQSRLGRTPWIRPFTDERLPELLRRGRAPARGRVPVLRGRLPRDARGDRHPRARPVAAARRRGARAAAVPERAPGVGGGGRGDAARGGRRRADQAGRPPGAALEARTISPSSTHRQARRRRGAAGASPTSRPRRSQIAAKHSPARAAASAACSSRWIAR